MKPEASLGIRVLDLSRVLAGPYCSMLLADMGADVIKLEVPGVGDDSRQFPPFKSGESLYYVNLNRGKRSIVIDLRRSDGRDLFLGLVRNCDVLMENFRPGTMERLGLGYDKLREANPRLIYAAISGFGQTGPYRSLPGYDIIGQAMGGLMSVTGWPDSPPTRVGTAIGDILSALFCCVGILAALRVRESTSVGQMVDIALVDSVFASLENIPQKLFVEGVIPERIGNRYEFVYPYDSFRARDGWVIIGIANDSIWHRFLEASGIQGLGGDPRFSSNEMRVENHTSLKPLIEGWIAEMKVVEIVSLMNENGVPACPIHDVGEVVDDPHVSEAREMVVEIDQPGLGWIRVLGNPVKMSETRPTPRGSAPALGEDTGEVLEELLGLDGAQISALRRRGVI